MVAVSFAGSGLLLLYYAGVASVLTQQGVIKPGDTPLGGISGGSVIAIQTCAGVPFEQVYMSMKLVWAFCQINYPGQPYCGGQGGPLLRSAVLQNLKTYGARDALLKCRGKLSVAVSELNPSDNSLLHPSPWTVSNPTSLEELADLAAASSFLPCSMAGQAFTLFRGKPVLDGGFAADFRHICGDSKRCIKVNALQVGANNPTNATPNCGFNPNLAQPAGQQSKPLNLKPIPRALWKLPDSCEYNQTNGAILSPQLPALTLPGAADIFPGFAYNRLEMDPCQWLSMELDVLAMTPQMIDFVYNQGMSDAAAWLEANSFPAGHQAG